MTRGLHHYSALHAQSFAGAVDRLARQPFATAMTVLVIAVALALPAGLRVLVGNVAALTGDWQGAADFSAYLAADVGDERAREIADEIERRDDVENVRLVSSDDALEDFRARSGLGGALDALDHNPLPHTLVVRPASGAAGDLESIAAALAAHAEVDMVQLDTEWVARLRAMLALAARVVDVATAVLGVGVVLVIGNTIRLEILNRAAEIEVVKLVGGTDAFIRRPFLYLGLCYGAGGAVAAAAVIEVALTLLSGPTSTLAALYGSDFRLAGLDLHEGGILLGGGALLGLAGAALATARHLRAIEPR
jgi:cell division transport system permease protein